MKKQLLLCDACGHETSLETMRLVIGRSDDGGSGSKADDIKYLDMCGGCLRMWLLSHVNSAKDYTAAVQVVDWCKDTARRIKAGKV